MLASLAEKPRLYVVSRHTARRQLVAQRSVVLSGRTAQQTDRNKMLSGHDTRGVGE